MCARLWNDLGLEGLRLELNSLGSAEERAIYRGVLVDYLKAREGELDQDSLRRMHTNPLRVLDSKNPVIAGVIADAPQMLDHLGRESLAHFEGVQRILKDSGIAYRINPRLVRGLDYYNLTVFEWVTDKLGAQGTVCAGGRYDGLFEQIGGKRQPACGWAMGVERLLALLEANAMPPQAPDVYLVNQGEEASRLAHRVAEALRDHGFSVVHHCGGGSFKSQMKKADASGARFAIIVGDDEAQAQEVSIKPLRERAEQTRCTVAQAVKRIRSE